MATARWLNNAAKAAIAGAAVTAVSQVASAAIAKWPCPAAPAVSQCDRLQTYAASMKGENLSADIRNKLRACLGAKP